MQDHKNNRIGICFGMQNTHAKSHSLARLPLRHFWTKGPHHRSRIHSLQFQFEVVDNCEGERSYLRRERCDAVRERAREAERERGRTTLSGMEPYFAVLFVWFNTLDDGIKKELIDGRFIIFGSLSVICLATTSVRKIPLVEILNQ